ncbi:Transient-receptor-hypothetical-like protein [Penaeus vannamei]|uniref:Transient-receptor-hypothetical-like protein n=1 Tax=Penaeus vannamei TaxID=6689 RepID=A0A3R7QNK9_PENVA|nr:Transient-receptor-hypothetical-like protein [Penaeus vannamei]
MTPYSPILIHNVEQNRFPSFSHDSQNTQRSSEYKHAEAVICTGSNASRTGSDALCSGSRNQTGSDPPSRPALEEDRKPRWLAYSLIILMATPWTRRSGCSWRRPKRGDKHTMMRCLSPPSPVNVNCTDILGRSAIQIAVDNENVEIVELLLLQETVKIGDALLYAITEGVYKIVEMLINHPSITPEMLANDWVRVRAGGEESSDFDPNISPIILAAHCNQFEILQLFLAHSDLGPSRPGRGPPPPSPSPPPHASIFQLHVLTQPFTEERDYDLYDRRP